MAFSFLRLLDEGFLPNRPGTLLRVPNARHYMCCPKCGRWASLDHTVKVNDQGGVDAEPSLICPFSSCGAHYFVANSQIINA